MRSRMSTPLACPNCGAPAQAQLGQTLVTCSYCHQSFQIDAPAPPPMVPTPPPQPVIQPIVVVAPGESFSDSAPVAVAAGWAGMRILFALLPVVVILISSGAFWWTRRAVTTGIPGMGGGDWSGSTPMVCSGNDSVDVTGVHASFSTGPAVVVDGNCQFTCTGCALHSQIGILVSGNGSAVLTNTSVEGTQHGIIAEANGTVRMLGNSTLRGDVLRSGNAQVSAPTPATPAAPPPAAAPPRPAEPPRSGPSPAAPARAPSRHH